ncbi:hypothetical protein [Microbispora sp. NBC_01389]|uniref:hypothetical protein n=1 Tax=Microbispora sp. NBC_01389 TaxID=2903584 RepID=UPI0032484CA5
MSSVIAFFRDIAIEAGRKLFDNEFDKGFDEATDICMSTLQKNIDDLMSKMKSGNLLSDQEQFLLSRLDELKSETEDRLRGGRGTDNGR